MAPGSDMFASLPEELLCDIVSRLPFKEAVKTSQLSKRWNPIWRFTRNLEFVEDMFVKRGMVPEVIVATQRRLFVDFINRWFVQYQSHSVDRLCIKLSKPKFFQNDVERCIAFCIQLGVSALDLDFSNPPEEERERDLEVLGEDSSDDNDNDDDGDVDNGLELFELPACVYGASSILKSLKLHSCSFDKSDILKLHNLREVSFSGVKLSTNFLHHLLMNCTKLESLILKNCEDVNHLYLRPHAGVTLSLKTLIVEQSKYASHWYCFFDAPNVKYLKYDGRVGTFYMKNMVGLEEVDLCFVRSLLNVRTAHTIHQLLLDLCNVKSLTVCSYLLQDVQGIIPTSPQLSLEIRNLTLKTTLLPNEYYGITFLVKSCPHLETLTIEIVAPKIFNDNYIPPFGLENHEFSYRYHKYDAQRWDCELLQTLKVIQMKDCMGSPNELCVLDYFIVYGKALEKMTVHLKKDHTARFTETVTRVESLLRAPRASPNLVIQMIYG